MKNVKLVTIKEFGQAQLGYLSAIESEKDVSFAIKRVYYITRVPHNVTRGFHSHNVLEQVLLCLNGSVKIRTKTPFEEDVFVLDSPSKGLYIGPMIWREMFDFSEGSVLLVLASEYFSEDDYIRDYSAYEKEARIYFG